MTIFQHQVNIIKRIFICQSKLSGFSSIVQLYTVTYAAAIDVPVNSSYPPSFVVEITSTPGAEKSILPGGTVRNI